MFVASTWVETSMASSPVQRLHFTSGVRPHPSLVAVALVATVLFTRSVARAVETAPEESPATMFRLWLEPPLGGVMLGYGDSPTTTENLRLGAVALELEASNLFTFEAGVGALFSSVGGEVGFVLNPDAWLRLGIAPVLHDFHSGGAGWILQLSTMIGYRHVEQRKIVYEDHGVDAEAVEGVALDVGPVFTHASASGTGLALRLLTGVIVPVDRSHSSRGYTDFPLSRLAAAVSIGLELGWTL